jgi:hypothetical protein
MRAADAGCRATKTPIAAEILPLLTAEQMAESIRVTELLGGVIADVRTTVVSVLGPTVWRLEPPANQDEVLLFLAGRASYRARDQSFAVLEETIARAPLGWTIEVEPQAGAVVHFFWIRKRHRGEDLEDLARYPENHRDPWVRAFRECPPYGEAIKSAKTVSRTLLPEGLVPRVAVGSVETVGPDEVARHRHPMLQQLFLGLARNDARVQIDDADVQFGEAHLLHIPLGSTHGATVAEERRLYYVWMDFFMTREAQAHLRSHRPLESR